MGQIQILILCASAEKGSACALSLYLKGAEPPLITLNRRHLRQDGPFAA